MIKLLIKKLLTRNNSGRIKYLQKRGCTIGDSVILYCGVDSFGSEPYLITIGNNVTITNGVRLLTHDGGMRVISKLYGVKWDKFGKIVIGNNVFIGIDSIIMPNVTIGDNCIIGAGSVVTSSCESNFVYAGVPARKICSITEYYNKNKTKVDETRGMNPSDKEQYLLNKYNGSEKNEKI